MGGGVGEVGGMLGSMSMPTSIMAVGSAVSLGTKLVGGSMQKSQIETQIEQEKAANAARASDRAKQLNQSIARSAVSGAAKGLGAGSSTFRQVSQQSFDSFHEDQERDNLNLSFQEAALRSKISAIDAQSVGDVFSGAAKVAGISALGSSKTTDADKELLSTFFGG